MCQIDKFIIYNSFNENTLLLIVAEALGLCFFMEFKTAKLENAITVQDLINYLSKM